jgi:dihydroorotase
MILSDAKVHAHNEISECCIAVNKGRIFKIGKEANMPKADVKISLGKLLVLPGLIDAHVHLRDEGKAYKEDFYSGTAAAAAGGIATVLDMPNNAPVTMSADALKNRMDKAERNVLVNVGLFSEFPKDMNEIKQIVKKGAVAFKLFMAEQVGGLEIDDDNALLEAFKILRQLGMRMAVHAEDKAMLRKAENDFKYGNRNDVESYLKAHSESVEVEAINRILSLVEQANTRTHFCHVTTADGLKAIVDKRKYGISVTCETTPHNLFLSTDDLKRVGTLAVTMPPVREKYHIAALWEGIKDGSIDIIASDHAPHMLEEKQAKSVWDVKAGIPGLETTLPLLLTEVERGRLTIGDIVRLMAENPAETYCLKDRGCLKEGNHADFTVVDLHREYKIDSSRFHSKAKYSPFDRWLVRGKPVKTFVNGRLIMDEGEIVAKPGSGAVIRRA